MQAAVEQVQTKLESAAAKLSQVGKPAPHGCSRTVDESTLESGTAQASQTEYPHQPPCCGKCFPVVFVGIVCSCAAAVTAATFSAGHKVSGDLDIYAYLTVAALVVGGIGLTAYWIVFFWCPGGDPAPYGWYVRYQRSFPLPDGFTAIMSFACAANIAARNSYALNLGLITSGCFFFLGFVDIWFDHTNKLYSLICTGTISQKVSMLLELVINVFSVGIALWLSCYFAFLPPFGNHP
jgi:hypothetical protein